MTWDEILYRLEWFKWVVDQLEASRKTCNDDLAELEGIEVSNWAYLDDSGIGPVLKKAVDGLRKEIQRGAGASMAQGAAYEAKLAGAIHATGKDYLLQEAKASNLSAEITAKMQELGF